MEHVFGLRHAVLAILRNPSESRQHWHFGLVRTQFALRQTERKSRLLSMNAIRHRYRTIYSNSESDGKLCSRTVE